MKRQLIACLVAVMMLTVALCPALAENEYVKHETVYGIIDSNGNIQTVIPTIRLENKANEDVLNDKTILENIMNVKGDEKFTAGENGAIVWQANGDDIYYRGTTDKALPVTTHVTWTLDGESIEYKALLGKSGKVTMHVECEALESADVNGTKTAVPFLTVSGLLLDSDIFTNVEMTNGVAISDGSHTVAVGYSVAGVVSANETVNQYMPTYFELTADVKNFSVDTMMTVATNNVTKGESVDLASLTSSVSGMPAQLTDAMTQLMDGANAIKDGLDTVVAKSGELTSGVTQLVSGSTTLKDGITKLQTGASTLQNGVATLNDGLNTLTSKNEALNAGAKTVFDTMLQSVYAQLTATGAAVPELTIDNYAATLDAVITKMTAAQMDVTALTAAKAQLDSYNQFYQGLQEYTAGVASAAEGSKTLKEGAVTLNASGVALKIGANTLTNGMTTLQSGTDTLIDGINQLDAGAGTLAEGLSTFNTEAIVKLTDIVNNDLNPLVNELQGTLDAAALYSHYDDVEEGVQHTLVFIIRTDLNK